MRRPMSDYATICSVQSAVIAVVRVLSKYCAISIEKFNTLSTIYTERFFLTIEITLIVYIDDASSVPESGSAMFKHRKIIFLLHLPRSFTTQKPPTHNPADWTYRVPALSVRYRGQRTGKRLEKESKIDPQECARWTMGFFLSVGKTSVRPGRSSPAVCCEGW